MSTLSVIGMPLSSDSRKAFDRKMSRVMATSSSSGMLRERLHAHDASARIRISRRLVIRSPPF